MENVNVKKYNVSGGILYFILGLFQIINIFNCLINKTNPLSLIVYLACYIILGFLLLNNKKEDVIILCFALLAILQIIDFFKGFSNYAYAGSVWKYLTGTVYKFRVVYCLPSLASALGYILTLLISVVLIKNISQDYFDKAKQYFFIPSILIVGSLILAFFAVILGEIGIIDGYWVNSNVWFSFWNILNRLLLGGAVLLTLMWLAYPDGMPKKKSHIINNQNVEISSNEFQNSGESAFYPLINHVLLLLLTFGIWNFIWIYRTTKYLNRVQGETYRDPTKKLLLCMFVPFYSIYWTYISAQRIDKIAKGKGIESDLATICLILSIFVAFVPPILMQEKINKIETTNSIDVGNENNSNYNSQPAYQTAESAKNVVNNQNIDVVDQLKKYKDLLDTGVITEEEFNNKKKQLLNL